MYSFSLGASWIHPRVTHKVFPLSTARRHVGTVDEYRYISTRSWPWHYMEVSGQLHAPATLPLRKNPGTHWI